MISRYLPLAILLGLCGCSSDSLVNEPIVCPPPSADQTLTLNIVSSGDKESRGGRIITSSEAANDVDIVTLAVYQLGEDSKIGRKVFSRNLSWKDSVAALQEGQMVHINLKSARELASTGGLDDGQYTIIAVGYSTDHDFSFHPSADNLDAESPIPAILVPSDSSPEEIFAGSIQSVEVKDRQFVQKDGETPYKTLSLRRQTSGTFGYFINIPSKGFDGTPATHLRLVASNKNNLLRMGGFNESGTVANIVNGIKDGTVPSDAKFASGADGFTVYETALTDWFPKGDVTGDGVLNDKDANYNGMSGNWKVPTWLDDKISVKVGTIFCSSFIVPFLHTDQPTFELQLIAKVATGGIMILRHWRATTPELQGAVKLVEADGSLSAEGPEETNSSYSVLRNHIYSMGKKSLSHPDPDSPSDGDEPEDLSKGEIVVMTINDNWEGHNRLIIKPQI